MKFSIGDKVVLKHTDEEGVIISYIDEQMVEVEVGDTSFPVHVDEIDHPYLKWFTEKQFKPAKKKVLEEIPVEKIKEKQQRLAKGIYISFIPQFKIDEIEDVVDTLKIYVLNELPKNIQLSYEYIRLGNKEFQYEGRLQGFGHLHLHTIPFDDMNDLPRFNWSVDDLEDADMKPERGQLKLKPQKVFAQINNMLLNNEPSFSYLLLEDFMPVQKEGKATTKPTFKPNKQKRSVRSQNSFENLTAKYEIDLHIENLVDNYNGMSNGEILNIQLSTLQTYLRLAINNRQDYMIIIHGVGKGKLRDEVHHILSETQEVHSYANDWQGRYGFGATEVRFKY